MKVKVCFLVMTFALLVSTNNVFAQLNCDEIIYCNYKGIYNDINEVEEEFKMLLEFPRRANFREMFGALRYIVSCSEENKKCAEALENPNCNVSIYTKKLVNFYESNEMDIKDTYVKEVFETFKAGAGKNFFKK